MRGLRRNLRSGMRGSRGPSGLDPTSLILSGWYRGSYTAAPWTGTASGGSSGSNTWQNGSGPPGAGVAVNGYTPVTFSGATHLIDAVTTVPNYITTTAYRVILLINAASAAAPAGNIFDNPGLLTENGGNWGIVYNTDGVNVYHNDGSYKVATKTCSTGAWHVVDVSYNGTTLSVQVDAGTAATVAAGTLGSIVGAVFRIGGNYNAAVKFTGDMMEAISAQDPLVSTVPSSFKSYLNSRYALSL